MSAFTLGGVVFRMVPGERTSLRSNVDEFILMKNEATLQFYESLKMSLPKEIMEVGIHEGGSLVYFDKLFKPSKLVGVDRRPGPLPALEEYCRERHHIKVYLSRFQDKAGVLRAARENFPNGVDLIIDDASHRYSETKSTFEMLYPLLRAGGHYAIERWNIFSNREGLARTVEVAAKDGEPCPESSRELGADRFIHELITLATKSKEISVVTIHRDVVCVQKGNLSRSQ